MMTVRRAATIAAIAALTLGGCGGGGGSSGGMAPPVALPGPTPTPTPTPAPTPPPTYAAASDFSGDREYVGWGVQMVRNYSGPSAGSPPGTNGTSVFTTSLATNTGSVGFRYTAATKSYVVRWFQSERSFGPVTSVLSQGLIPYDYVSQDFGRGHFYATPTTPDYTRYLGYVSWWEFEGSPGNGFLDSVSRQHQILFGVPSVPTDLPSTGTYRFEILNARMWGGFAAEDYRVGDDLLIAIDWATGAVTGTLTIVPATAAVFPIVLTMNGTIDKGTSRITGTIAGAFSGSFSGAAFGPQGRELGIAMAVHNGAGGHIAAVTGGRAVGMPAG